MPKLLSQRLADLVVDFKSRQLEAALVERLKISVTDTLAATFAGRFEPSSRIAFKHVANHYPGRGSTIIGSRARGSPIGAAFANGTMAHASEFDDSSLSMYGHPSAAVFPAALAAAEVVGAPAARFLAALTVGVETAARLGKLVGPQHFCLGWHPTGTIGSIGAGAAAAKALGLGREATLAAICLAASRACGTRESVGTATKALQAGNAARSGLDSALLAARGADAPATALEGPHGFLVLYGANPDAVQKTARDLREGLELVEPGLSHKLYPCSGDIHAALDAVLALQEEFDIAPRHISHIVCRANRTAVANPSFAEPETAVQARFSFHYCIAAALVRRGLGLREFGDVALHDKAIRKLMTRVDVIALEDREAADSFCSPAEVEIVLNDGQLFRRRVQYMLGHPRNPITLAIATHKLAMTASGILGAQRLTRLVHLISELDGLPSIRLLARAAVPPLKH